jgi:TonB-dependent SusC/RagA subfamily outer membrane receptor
MSRSSPQTPHRTALAVTLLGTILLGFVPGCARPTATQRAEPRVAAPPGDTITAADLTSGPIEMRPQEPVASLFGRAPGVLVNVNPDGSISVRIRAAASFYASSEPLYVIDGSEVTPEPNGTLRINPHDIESIEVLKYPPETSLYGVRGGNGVVLITTKRPRR